MQIGRNIRNQSVAFEASQRSIGNITFNIESAWFVTKSEIGAYLYTFPFSSYTWKVNSQQSQGDSIELGLKEADWEKP